MAVLALNLAKPAMPAIAASIKAARRGAGPAMVVVVCDPLDDPATQDEHVAETRA